MFEMYLLTRLDIITSVATVLSIGGFAALATSILAQFDQSLIDEEDIPRVKKVKRWSAVLLTIGVLLLTFVPSKQDAFLIWGVGTTIDYLESNETAKQLPDKCVKALGKFADEYLSEE